jgi:hypothetical protein
MDNVRIVHPVAAVTNSVANVQAHCPRPTTKFSVIGRGMDIGPLRLLGRKSGANPTVVKESTHKTVFNNPCRTVSTEVLALNANNFWHT